MTLQIGNYRYYNKIIGKGAYSSVYHGRNIYTNESVAIKEIFYGNFSRIEKNHLDSEIAIMKKVDHKNVIKMIDIIKKDDEKLIYIITEYCERGTLNNVLESIDSMSEELINKYIKEIAEGLRYLQSHNIVHRDLKLTNILVGKNNTIKIADFGFAREVNNESLMNTLCGSPSFMAPEILFHYKYDTKSDLWSLGIIMYYLIYKSHPYDPLSNRLELTHKIKTVEIVYPYRNDISIGCISLVKSLLQKDSNKRITWDNLYKHPWLGLEYDNPLLNDSLSGSETGNNLMKSTNDLNVSNDFFPNLVSNDKDKYNLNISDNIDTSIDTSESIEIICDGKKYYIYNNYIASAKYKELTGPIKIPINDKQQSKSFYEYMSAPIHVIKESLKYMNSI